MTVQHRVFTARELIVVNSSGEADLVASKAAIRKIASDSQFHSQYEILMDLRDVGCDLTVTEIYDLASFMAWPNDELPTRRKIAVVADEKSLDCAEFLELCATNRGVNLHAFNDMKQAAQWLDGTSASEGSHLQSRLGE